MKTFDKCAAQGDILIIKIESLPDDVIKNKPDNNKHIVAHSETGHHHTIKSHGVDFYNAANDSMIMYLVVKEQAELIHNRSFDTHESISFAPGIYEVRRQREYIPNGWRRVED